MPLSLSILFSASFSGRVGFSFVLLLAICLHPFYPQSKTDVVTRCKVRCTVWYKHRAVFLIRGNRVSLGHDRICSF
jgi:hypothetical protein